MNFSCTCVVKIVFKMQIYLVHQLLNCNCVYWKIRPILSSKLRPINYKILILYIYIYIYYAYIWSCSKKRYRYFLFEASHWFASLIMLENYRKKLDTFFNKNLIFWWKSFFRFIKNLKVQLDRPNILTSGRHQGS